jgi:uncharacterized protein (TIGR02145 family)
MKKLLILLTTLSVTVLTFAQDSETMYIMKKGNIDYQIAVSNIDSIVFYKPEIQAISITTDPGVVINGVKWATRNVDEFGTFAPTPASLGKFYQWNRVLASSAIGTVSNWDYSFPSGISWTDDPSPIGWRVPTDAENRKLLDTSKVTYEWTTQDGVKGGKFTDKTTGNSIFLPAAGSRVGGAPDGIGEYGFYWSSTQIDISYALYLGFYLGTPVRDYYDLRYGQSIRPVAE